MNTPAFHSVEDVTADFQCTAAKTKKATCVVSAKPPDHTDNLRNCKLMEDCLVLLSA